MFIRIEVTIATHPERAIVSRSEVYSWASGGKYSLWLWLDNVVQCIKNMVRSERHAQRNREEDIV